MRRLAALLLLPLLLLPACKDSTGAGGLVGEYDLRLVNGTLPPVTVYSHPFGLYDRRVEGASMTVTDDSLRLVLVTRDVFSATVLPPARTDIFTVEYDRKGATLDLESGRPFTGGAAVGEGGTVSLLLEFPVPPSVALDTYGVALVFDRRR